MNLGHRLIVYNTSAVIIPTIITALAFLTFDLVTTIINTGRLGFINITKFTNGDFDRSFINLLIFAIIIFILSFIITNIIISLSFSKSILSPLSRLYKVSGEISKGNLDNEVIIEGDYEIKELCNSFEIMRLKLKESVNTQMKYDDNRKMLVSSISHDLKTPITSIKGYVEGIIDGVANTPEKLDKYLKTIKSKAILIDSMINDLLIFSRFDMSQIPFNLEKTDITNFLKNCISEFEYELLKENIKITFVLETKHSYSVMMDKEKICRVITNIIDNSRKFLPIEGGKLDVILRETKESIVVEIKDNGIGIKSEDLPFIFNRFFRADSSRNLIKGSGLGLAIAKQIIEGHKGSIWVRSKETEGTSIMFSLRKVFR